MTRSSLVTIVGARPQFIKASVVCQAFRKRPEVSEFILHTGQHFDEMLSQVFFDELDMPPPNLNLGISGGTHGQMTGRMIEGIEQVLLRNKPSAVLVYGDTNSTLAGALAAAKLHIPVAHIEAGLRSFNKSMPEEHNRRVADHLSTLLFCPTSTATENLKAEGLSAGVHHVGDVMYDLALQTGRDTVDGEKRILDRFGLERKQYAVATIHREENVSNIELFEEIIAFLRARASEKPVVFFLHPRTRDVLTRKRIRSEPLILSPPVSYREMSHLIRTAEHVYTDSGGLQKEAYFHRTPCTTMRSETEWPETIESGWNRLWKQPESKSRRDLDVFGDGDAAMRIVDILCAYLAET